MKSNQEIIDVVQSSQRIRTYSKTFIMDCYKWKDIDPNVLSIVSSSKWNEIKYFDDDAFRVGNSINSLPDDKGGVYCFYLKPNIIPGIHSYILYTGRARRAESFSLRQRCRQYARETKRPYIADMIHTWWNFLYLAYLPLDGDDLIEEVEEEMNRVIWPPFNQDIRDKYVVFDGEIQADFWRE